MRSGWIGSRQWGAASFPPARFFPLCLFLAGFFLLGIVGPQHVSARELTDREQEILRAVDAAFDDELAFVIKTVNINSGTRNLGGVRAVGAVMRSELSALGFGTRWIDMPAEMDRAGHLTAEARLGDGPSIQLIGHLDTVFPEDSKFQRAERIGERLYGPGVADMKGGNAVMLFAIKALKATGNLERGTLRVFLTGDEESTGKPLSLSRRDLIEQAKSSDIALNFEGGQTGTAVIGRRGSSSWRLEVSGRRAHSSGIFREGVGAGAVLEASRILTAFYGELRDIPGLTFNPGIIAGGTTVDRGKTAAHQAAFGKNNVVAATTVVNGGLRFLSHGDKEKAKAIMRRIVGENLPETSASISFVDSYPAMKVTPQNRRLLEVFSQVNEALGKGPVQPFPPERRGAADISFVAPHVPAAMDGLGAFGGGAHSEEEWASLDGLRFATRRTAIFLHRLLNEGN